MQGPQQFAEAWTFELGKRRASEKARYDQELMLKAFLGAAFVQILFDNKSGWIERLNKSKNNHFS